MQPMVGGGPGSPCESEVVAESEAWLEPSVGVGPGPPCESELVVESEA